MAVVDASVMVTVANRADPHHDVARDWHSRAVRAGEPLHAPWILVAEVAAAISRGQGDVSLAHRVVQCMTEGGLIHFSPIDAALAARAWAIAADRRIRGCDAVYVALAAELGETLVTLDAQQLARAAGVVEVHRPDI